MLKRSITRAFNKTLVEPFTGIERDRTGTSSRFCSPWLPWVLVASHVAEEGIDLQTYTRHIVHYEVEWNPARMEQREGRGDRRGRLFNRRNTKEPLDVYFPLVGQTYEERILHQLVMRMRWHGVLLGKGAVELADDEGERHYRSVSGKNLRAMQLDLSPRRG